jgi:hypothetical protein
VGVAGDQCNVRCWLEAVVPETKREWLI